MAEKLTRKEKIARQQKGGGFSSKQIEQQQKGNRSLKRMLGLIAAIAGFLLYANTLGHDFVLDDFGLIKDNTQVKRGISSVPEIFKTSYRYGMNITDYQLYRPLTKAMFAVEWQISPNNPALFHFINVILFALLCYVLFNVLSRYLNGDLIVPFITSLIFAAHPLHTEVVANIKSRDEIVCVLLLLSSMWFLHSYVSNNSTKGYLAGILCFFAALFSKESAVTFIAVIPLMFYFFTGASKDKYYKTIGAMIGCLLIFLLIRKNVLGDVKSLIPVEDNSLAGIKDFVLQKVNAIYILGAYLKLLVIPTPLISDASYNHFPPVELTSWKFLVPFIILLASGIYAILRFKKKDPVSFCILYFFITISIVSNVVILIGTNYGERLMFIPSLGICFLFGILISRALKSDLPEKAITDFKAFFAAYSKPVLLTLGIIIAFSFQTIARNSEWKDNLTLYETDVKKVPDSAHMLFYLANHITSEDYLAALPDSNSRTQARLKAIEYLTRSVTIYPKYADGFQRRGFIYNQMHDSLRAENDYKEALSYNPTHPIVYNNYGTLCFDQRRFDEAFKNFEQAVRYNPKYAHALNNFASTYGVFGQGEGEMITRDPANKEAHAKRSRENFENAIVYFLKAIDADPEFGEPYRLVAITYKNIGDVQRGEKYDQLYKQVMANKNAKN